MAVVGRDDERLAITRFVDRAGRGPGVLVLRGEAGIGKTALWSAAVADARSGGLTVLTARPAEAEHALAFAALSDLLGAVLDRVADSLPLPQLRALRVALLLDDPGGAPPDERATSAGLLSAFGALAAGGQLLVAVDDVQWLDPGSARALAFALRRLTTEPVAVLLAERAAEGDPMPLGLAGAGPAVAVEALQVEPLPASAVREVVATRVGASLDASALRRVHEVAGGNPFFAIELGRALGDQAADVGATLPVPTTLTDLVADRLAALPARSREVLPVVAALPQPTVDRVTAIGGEDAGGALDDAVAAGVLQREGTRLRFSHPLLASAAYAELGPARRRALHGRLAAAATDAVERGHHLAFATDRPDAVIAERIDEAATAAVTRGALTQAADLHAHARRLTPADDGQAARRRAAAEAHLRALTGETARGRALLDEALETCDPGPERAELLRELAHVETWGADWRRADGLLRRALGELGDADVALRANAELDLAMVHTLIGDEPETVAVEARRAADLAAELGDDALLAEALANEARAHVLLGRDGDALMQRALDLEPAAARLSPIRRPSDYFVEVMLWRDELDALGPTLRRIYEEAVAHGEETAAGWTLGRVALLLCATGETRRALTEAERALHLTELSGLRANEAVMLAVLARVAAQLGDPERTRASAQRACELAARHGASPADRLARSGVGLLELSRGDAAAALDKLEPLIGAARRARVGEPGAMRFVPDAVEAMAALGRIDEGREIIDWYEACARAVGRRSALAASARCRALLAGAAGDAERAAELLETAIGLHDGVPLPLELGRSLLALGAAHRRLRRKRAAREALEAAATEFDRIEASLWAARARDELARVGGRRPAGDDLTPTERRVAALVAAGHTNQQVARELFVSVRSVEANLTRVYAKLGIASRTELAAQRERLGL